MNPVMISPAAGRLPGAYLPAAARARAARALRLMAGELHPGLAARGAVVVRLASTG